MSLAPLLQRAIVPALQCVAPYSETHSLKGLLALDRLAKRHGLGEQQVTRLLGHYQLLTPPAVSGPISALCRHDLSACDDVRLRTLLCLPVFPLTYVAAVEWVRRHGVLHLVEAFREAAAHNVGFLGHSWTIWCSFLEFVPHLSSELERTLFAERFAELVGVQLREPTILPTNAAVEDEVAVCHLALEHPGFLGHVAITLAYLYRHRALLTEAEWQNGLAVVRRLATTESELSRHAAPYVGRVDAAAFERLALDTLERGQAEVHTLTGVDAAFDLWQLDDEPTRRRALGMLVFMRDPEASQAAGKV